MDRLILELQLSPVEAFRHLRRVLENANALASTLVASEIIRIREDEHDGNRGEGLEAVDQEEERLTKIWNFAPEKGNVIFTSALDSWGFSTGKFATIWAQKLQVNRGVLLKYMFDDFAFNPKTKKLFRCDADNSNATPLFASLVLEPISQIYQTCIVQQDPAKAAKMAQRGVCDHNIAASM